MIVVLMNKETNKESTHNEIYANSNLLMAGSKTSAAAIPRLLYSTTSIVIGKPTIGLKLSICSKLKRNSHTSRCRTTLILRRFSGKPYASAYRGQASLHESLLWEAVWSWDILCSKLKVMKVPVAIVSWGGEKKKKKK